MNAKIIALLGAVLLLVGVIALDSTLEPVALEDISVSKGVEAVGTEPVPDFSFVTMKGDALGLADIEHEEILVHFWAGWCTVCFAEFPELLDYVGRQNGKTALLAIAIDDTLPPAQDFMARLEESHDISLEREHVYWIWDADKSISLQTFNTIRVPETIVVNADRVMARKIVGAGEW